MSLQQHAQRSVLPPHASCARVSFTSHKHKPNTLAFRSFLHASCCGSPTGQGSGGTCRPVPMGHHRSRRARQDTSLFTPPPPPHSVHSDSSSAVGDAK
eukprot:6953386-Prymnesium_polylepis.1